MSKRGRRIGTRTGVGMDRPGSRHSEKQGPASTAESAQMWETTATASDVKDRSEHYSKRTRHTVDLSSSGDDGNNRGTNNPTPEPITFLLRLNGTRLRSGSRLPSPESHGIAFEMSDRRDGGRVRRRCRHAREMERPLL
ncbi:hypothetical protein EVAR_102986_1 [Eumeta japonica]|uniref:Uncharacterized protein n=1 Tax=Eumeta variegata TaxID=151549 RepID=A0A4C1UPL4_EUMVA|nr:hypothetical protein EVAR_102986_1 [Eumeta japonica]